MHCHSTNIPRHITDGGFYKIIRYARVVSRAESGALHMPVKRSDAAVGIQAMAAVRSVVVEAARE